MQQGMPALQGVHWLAEGTIAGSRSADAFPNQVRTLCGWQCVLAAPCTRIGYDCNLHWWQQAPSLVWAVHI
jgi:hypothetical protein